MYPLLPFVMRSNIHGDCTQSTVVSFGTNLSLATRITATARRTRLHVQLIDRVAHVDP